MTYISLPLIQYNFELNNQLQKFSYSYKNNKEEYFKIKDLELTSFYGSFPFAIWNGGSNLNIKNETFLLNDDIYQIFKNTYNPIRLDCSNLLITDVDLQNGYQNLILEYGHNSGNFIEVADFGVLEYIQKTYPNYDFIFSKNAHFAHPFTADIINTLIESEVFCLIELPNELRYDLEFLDKLKYKNYIEITIGNKCKMKCSNESYCCLTEQEYQYNFSEKTQFSTCDQLNNYSNANQILTEVNYFKNLGFTHFKIDTPPINKLQQFQQFLVLNLIQEKYQLSFLYGDSTNDK